MIYFLCYETVPLELIIINFVLVFVILPYNGTRAIAYIHSQEIYKSSYFITHKNVKIIF